MIGEQNRLLFNQICITFAITSTTTMDCAKKQY